MPINPHKAAEIAKANGLTLADARALAAMAENEADAAEMARVFNPENDPDKIAQRILNQGHRR